MKSLEEERAKRIWEKGIECRQVGEGNGVAGEGLEIQRTTEERGGEEEKTTFIATIHPPVQTKLPKEFLNAKP